MNLYLRLIALFIKLIWRSKLDVLEQSVARFHVLPNDLDTNMHMNNGRYLTIMDLGRLDLMARTGLMRKALKNNLAPVLGSAKIRFRLPLFLFQAYDLHTKVICWDEKYFYIEQRFVIAKGKKAGAVAAIAFLKAGLYNTKKKIVATPLEILTLVGKEDMQSPQVPAHVKAWIDAEEKVKDLTKKAA